MVDSTSNEDKSRNGEGKMSSFAAAAVAALCCSLKNSAMDPEKFQILLPLLFDTLSKCPTNELNILLDLLNGLYDFVASGGVNNHSWFFHSQSELSEVMDPLMENLRVDHPLFCSFLSTFEKLCQFLNEDARSIKRSLTKMCMKALRFPLEEEGTHEAERVKKAKSDSWRCISYWIICPIGFEPLGEELSDVVIELIESEKDVEKLEGYVTALHHLLKVVKWDETITEPRRIWIKFWRSLNRMIEEDMNREVTSLFVQEVANCIETMSKEATQLFADSVLYEIGIMVKNLFEKEMRRIDNNEPERIPSLLNIAVTIFRHLLPMKKPIAHILNHLMPIVFPLIDKCNNKFWGVRFMNILLINVPEFVLQFRNQVYPLLFHTLNDQRSKMRRQTADAFGHMAESNIDEWKEMAVSSIDLLCAMIEREDARLEGNISATEEALGAVIKIMKYCDEKMVGIGRMNEILSRFLSWFPFAGESSECTNIYGFLIDLIESHHFSLNIEPNSNTPRLLYILTKAIHDELFDDEYEMKERVKATIMEMASVSDSFEETVRLSGLNEDEKASLRRILAPTN